MKIISYLLDKLNGFKIGINESGNAELISYRNHPFASNGGGSGEYIIDLTQEEAIELAEFEIQDISEWAGSLGSFIGNILKPHTINIIKQNPASVIIKATFNDGSVHKVNFKFVVSFVSIRTGTFENGGAVLTYLLDAYTQDGVVGFIKYSLDYNNNNITNPELHVSKSSLYNSIA